KKNFFWDQAFVTPVNHRCVALLYRNKKIQQLNFERFKLPLGVGFN
ncbi:MAG: hypothetical protein JWQ09_991, partial [Segetibacter sp.]|nr:hypothetical protein [Segetibacter sp.]